MALTYKNVEYFLKTSFVNLFKYNREQIADRTLNRSLVNDYPSGFFFGLKESWPACIFGVERKLFLKKTYGEVLNLKIKAIRALVIIQGGELVKLTRSNSVQVVVL